ncbi:hypothetical protein EDC04DRAFT_2729963 [Pisolithus marmoratus]|nr:hypothetical protein EDC04DRAFT_2729963 [Pisolithus marmoratus]
MFDAYTGLAHIRATLLCFSCVYSQPNSHVPRHSHAYYDFPLVLHIRIAAYNTLQCHLYGRLIHGCGIDVFGPM